MNHTAEKLAELQKELAGITKELQARQLTHIEAADKIAHLKEQIDEIVSYLKLEARKKIANSG
jgi:hypothetical protein